jgi:hypothetical protein
VADCCHPAFQILILATTVPAIISNLTYVKVPYESGAPISANSAVYDS